jgi:hypothetical protein
MSSWCRLWRWAHHPWLYPIREVDPSELDQARAEREKAEVDLENAEGLVEQAHEVGDRLKPRRVDDAMARWFDDAFHARKNRSHG